MFIALEGGDGSGKSTQARLLSEWMDGQGIQHLVAREPGGTETGEAIRDLALNRLDLDFTPMAELFLMLASRAEFVHQVVRPTLARGELLVSDRFSLSTLVYQGIARGVGLEEAKAAVDLATGGLTPDLYLILDVDPQEAHARQAAGGGRRDRLDAAGPDFMRRVRDGYLQLAQEVPNCVVLDGSGNRDAVQREVMAVVSELLAASTLGSASAAAP